MLLSRSEGQVVWFASILKGFRFSEGPCDANGLCLVVLLVLFLLGNCFALFIMYKLSF